MLLCIVVGFITLTASAPSNGVINHSTEPQVTNETQMESRLKSVNGLQDSVNMASSSASVPSIESRIQDSVSGTTGDPLSSNTSLKTTITTRSIENTILQKSTSTPDSGSDNIATSDSTLTHVTTDLNYHESNMDSTVSEPNTESHMNAISHSPEMNPNSSDKIASETTNASNTDATSAETVKNESSTDSTSDPPTTESTITTSKDPTSDPSTTESTITTSKDPTSDPSTTESTITTLSTDSTTDLASTESTDSTTVQNITSSTNAPTDTTTNDMTTVTTSQSTSSAPTETTTSTTNEPITDTSTPDTTYESTPITTPPVTTPPTPNSIAVDIVAGVLGLLLLGGLLATGAVMHHQGKLPWNPRNSNSSVRPQPILLSKFETHCKELLDTPARLGSEYQLLLTLSSDIHDTNTVAAAQLPDNKKKNRYVNILPYDLTRVKLDVTYDDPSSDYINASFIKGFSNNVEYIASQGPKEETVSDFWRMIYQHDVQLIVMVTNLEEGGKIKCDPYLPKLREQMTSGEIIIRCCTELHFPIHTQRSIVLHKDDTKRSITHLHFNEWPDFGCPEGTDSMLLFCQTIRHIVATSPPGLVLVHCSAGVGRTGTLIATDILLQHIQGNRKVDVFGTVFKLRKQRTNMVQTIGQYAYIYKSIRDAILDPAFLKTEDSPSNSMEPIYENVPTKLTTFVYEQVPIEVKAKSTSSESECEL